MSSPSLYIHERGTYDNSCMYPYWCLILLSHINTGLLSPSSWLGYTQEHISSIKHRKAVWCLCAPGTL